MCLVVVPHISEWVVRLRLRCVARPPPSLPPSTCRSCRSSAALLHPSHLAAMHLLPLNTTTQERAMVPPTRRRPSFLRLFLLLLALLLLLLDPTGAITAAAPASPPATPRAAAARGGNTGPRSPSSSLSLPSRWLLSKARRGGAIGSGESRGSGSWEQDLKVRRGREGRKGGREGGW